MLLLKTQPHDFMIKIKPLPNNTQGTHRRYNFLLGENYITSGACG